MFKAVNEFGKPADIEGVVLNQNGRVITNFKSYHQGMGAFRYTPVSGDKYIAKITKPEGIEKEYTMPEPLKRGFVLSIINYLL